MNRPFRMLPMIPRGLEEAPMEPVLPPGPKPVRRRLLGALAAFSVAPVVVQAAAPATPDADLIRACDDYCTAFAAARAAEVARAPDDEWDAAHDRADAALDRVEAIPAVTIAGVVAKARAVSLYRGMMAAPPDQQNWDERLADNLIADLLRIGGAA